MYLNDRASADAQKTSQKRLNTTHSTTNICACRRPHTSQRSIQYKICGCRWTTVTLAHKWTLVAGEDEGSGHSFIALSCPTKYLPGEARLLLPPPRELQVAHHSVWFMGYHHEVSRMKHTSRIYLRNTLFRHPNDFHPALDPKPKKVSVTRREQLGSQLFFILFLYLFVKERCTFLLTVKARCLVPLHSRGYVTFLQCIPRRIRGGKNNFSCTACCHNAEILLGPEVHAEISLICKTWDPTFMAPDFHECLQVRRLDILSNSANRWFKKQKAMQVWWGRCTFHPRPLEKRKIKGWSEKD